MGDGDDVRGPASGAARDPVLVDRDGLDRLIEHLRAGGRDVRGPVVRDAAVMWGPVATTADLPVGWGDEQSPGRYRLRRRDDDALFGFAVGPDSPKRAFLAPRRDLWRGAVERSEDGTPVRVRVASPPEAPAPVALVGLRGCELAAVSVQDRVLAAGAHPDPAYVAARRDAVLVSVDCGSPAATCACTTFGTGPEADGRGGDVVADLRLTELPGGGRFVARAQTPTGHELLDAVGGTPAAGDDVAAADAVVAAAARKMDRRLHPEDTAAALAAAPDHPRWDEVATRCLACGNCTSVCPTCFCTSVEDTTDLAGDEVVRTRRWDSCFTTEHSYLHGGAVHPDVRSRYRQWLTHKLSTWWDQFGTSGCVGCGRCTTWCPVGIDLFEEATAVTAP